MRKFIKFIFILLILIFICYYGLKNIFPLEHKDLVEKYSLEYSVDKNLIYAVIKAESNFTADAVSHVGANGLMQLTDNTAYWIASRIGDDSFKIENISDPETNIKYGVWYIKYLSEQLENTDLVIMSYNAGINNVLDWIDNQKISTDEIQIQNIPYRETKIYLTKVKTYRKIYELLY